ncbi:DUF7109 family protein [Salinigranum sp. GCM10025319]|uniref:DUF7109 family protein n=1 Tax=Salinigranum sp. GCM10025319 TaxID=3252687 RepID=UPI00360C27B8
MTADVDAGDSGGEPFDAPALPVDDPDELAGVVDLFGALAREEVTRALVELAYRQGSDADESAIEAAAGAAVAAAVERYFLVEYVPEGATDSPRVRRRRRDDRGRRHDRGDPVRDAPDRRPRLVPVASVRGRGPPAHPRLPHAVSFEGSRWRGRSRDGSAATPHGRSRPTTPTGCDTCST